jgi:histidinol-phosphate aminotransferase
MMIMGSEMEAIELTDFMLRRGVILRRLPAFGLPNCIRVTIGLDHEMDHFESVLEEFSKQ